MPGIKTQNLNIFRRTPAPSFCLGVTVKSYLTQIIYLTDSAPRIPSYNQTRRAGSSPGDLGREGPEV